MVIGRLNDKDDNIISEKEVRKKLGPTAGGDNYTIFSKMIIDSLFLTD